MFSAHFFCFALGWLGQLLVVRLLGFANFLDVDVDNIIKPFPEFALELELPADILLKKVDLLIARKRGEYNAGTLLHEHVALHKLLNQVLLQLHQVIDLQIAQKAPFLLASVLVLHLSRVLAQVIRLPVFAAHCLQIEAFRAFDLAGEMRVVGL